MTVHHKTQKMLLTKLYLYYVIKATFFRVKRPSHLKQKRFRVVILQQPNCKSTVPADKYIIYWNDNVSNKKIDEISLEVCTVLYFIFFLKKILHTHPDYVRLRPKCVVLYT